MKRMYLEVMSLSGLGMNSGWLNIEARETRVFLPGLAISAG